MKNKQLIKRLNDAIFLIVASIKSSEILHKWGEISSEEINSINDPQRRAIQVIKGIVVSLQEESPPQEKDKTQEFRETLVSTHNILGKYQSKLKNLLLDMNDEINQVNKNNK